MTIQMKGIEQYFPVVLFVMLFKVVLLSKTFDEAFQVLAFKYTGYGTILTRSAVTYMSLETVNEILRVGQFKW